MPAPCLCQAAALWPLCQLHLQQLQGVDLVTSSVPSMAGQLIPVLPGCRRLNNRPLNPGSTTLNRYMVTRFASRIVAIKGKVRLGSGGGQPSSI